MKRFLQVMAFALAALIAAALPAAAQQQEETSLGEVAKQNKKPAKVLTEDDLKSSGGSATPADPSSDADKEKDQDKQEAAAEDPNDTRSDVEKAQDDVKKWEHEEDTLKRKLDKLQEKEAAETSEFRKQMYRDAVNNQQTTLGELAQKKAEAEKKLSDAQSKEQEEGPKPKKKPAATPDEQSSEPPQ